MAHNSNDDNNNQSGGSLIEILLTSLRLGLTSFGGPVAHLAYFKEEYVNKMAR